MRRTEKTSTRGNHSNVRNDILGITTEVLFVAGMIVVAFLISKLFFLGR